MDFGCQDVYHENYEGAPNDGTPWEGTNITRLHRGGSVHNEAGVIPDYVKSGTYEIEVAGVRYSAQASLRPLYDPKGKRVRS